ncbi:hypothetical protein [Rhizobium leguminosarum]|uniref:Uncharacterized protein n=1 Tax=Rhizobium leguminosarum bv. viciae TaxID=387 RepID=A0A7G6RJA5_RHILV|nr:hypothetical protein [Rhizobium leguminosarum]ASS57594.1 hypothetical protein CHR56_25255 [Rhizobium leguminosarum bv. viciae]QND42337.1 hypothetical protein HB770_11035 [Rhizobium leguminosarum bv. viciae]TBY17483.1 hypothetical protein E0H30_26035 [Rhizobium leguminosarum bv. viciae]TBY24628.1 hypothetical protein E0H37_23185 [Rhizobium leguminosarum bv. viciae]TBY99708.1 hypothetical protein E0H49_17495 [Rhizobium leguminosarum bv. viciae]
MARYIAVYDIAETYPDPHSEFITQAEKLGWVTWVWAPARQKWYKLPNTTLIGEFADRDAAKAAFNDAAKAARAEVGKLTIEKYFIADYGAGAFDSDVTADLE